MSARHRRVRGLDAVLRFADGSGIGAEFVPVGYRFYQGAANMLVLRKG